MYLLCKLYKNNLFICQMCICC